MANKSWKADQEVTIKTYQALIRSKLDYYALVYNLAKPSTLKMIHMIQNAALRIATGNFKNSPINSILFELKEASLDQRRRYISLKYITKMSSTPDNLIYNNIIINRFLL